MEVRLCCPGEVEIEVPPNSKEPLADACRITDYKYHMAIGPYNDFTYCSCVKCIDECRKIEDEEKRNSCWWSCRCGPCTNPFTGDC